MSVKEEHCTKAVLDYLVKQNRPYSCTDVQANLHNEFGKSAVNKALERLVSDGKIKAKTYNKQVVYVSDQDAYLATNDVELEGMDTAMLKVAAKIKTLVDECKILESTLQKFVTEVKTEDAEIELKTLQVECDEFRKRLPSLKSNANIVSQDVKIAIAAVHNNYSKEWRKRKRLCNEMINAVLENYPKSKKALLEETGIETDEDLRVNIADFDYTS